MLRRKLRAVDISPLVHPASFTIRTRNALRRGQEVEIRVSESDSFINEVTEEVRREKLYGYLRRYGWIAVAAVLLLVGGAAFNEFRNAQARDAAQNAGDALLTALETSDLAGQATAFEAVGADGPAAAIAALLRASTLQEAGEFDGAAAVLRAVASDGDVPENYRDVAAMKAAMLPTTDVESRRASLEALSAPGLPFRLLALEQLAYMHLDGGDVTAAVALLRQIEEDATATRGMRERVQTLLVALGEPLPGLASE